MNTHSQGNRDYLLTVQEPLTGFALVAGRFTT